jgi:hypothetical protein
MVTYQPQHHCCFSGEIVDFGTLLRLQMEIKDVNGVNTLNHMHRQGARGSALFY